MWRCNTRRVCGAAGQNVQPASPRDKEKSTAKGVKRSHAQKYIKHAQYKDCLFKEKQTKETFYILQSKNHLIKAANLEKFALSCYDDKRQLLPHTSNTIAYGYNPPPN